jgi:hypothetical protein
LFKIILAYPIVSFRNEPCRYDRNRFKEKRKQTIAQE